MKVIEVTPTISTSIYAAGDAAADYAGGPSNSVATDDLTVKLFVEES